MSFNCTRNEGQRSNCGARAARVGARRLEDGDDDEKRKGSDGGEKTMGYFKRQIFELKRNYHRASSSNRYKSAYCWGEKSVREKVDFFVRGDGAAC